jgi:hypothetical protein
MNKAKWCNVETGKVGPTICHHAQPSNWPTVVALPRSLQWTHHLRMIRKANDSRSLRIGIGCFWYDLCMPMGPKHQ